MVYIDQVGTFSRATIAEFRFKRIFVRPVQSIYILQVVIRNSPIYDECKTQSAKVLALTLEV